MTVPRYTLFSAMSEVRYSVLEIIRMWLGVENRIQEIEAGMPGMWTSGRRTSSVSGVLQL